MHFEPPGGGGGVLSLQFDLKVDVLLNTVWFSGSFVLPKCAISAFIVLKGMIVWRKP